MHLSYIVLDCCYVGKSWSNCCRTRLEDQKVVVYASRQLKVHGRNYPMHNLELAQCDCLEDFNF